MKIKFLPHSKHTAGASSKTSRFTILEKSIPCSKLHDTYESCQKCRQLQR